MTARRWAIFVWLWGCNASDTPSATAPVEANPPPVEMPHPALPEGPGRELVVAHCTACHASEVIAGQRMSRERWAETIVWMQETQGLWPVPGEQLDAVLDYLAAQFGPNASEMAASPWSTPRYPPNPMWRDDR